MDNSYSPQVFLISVLPHLKFDELVSKNKNVIYFFDWVMDNLTNKGYVSASVENMHLAINDIIQEYVDYCVDGDIFLSDGSLKPLYILNGYMWETTTHSAFFSDAYISMDMLAYTRMIWMKMETNTIAWLTQPAIDSAADNVRLFNLAHDVNTGSSIIQVFGNTDITIDLVTTLLIPNATQPTNVRLRNAIFRPTNVVKVKEINEE